MTRIKMKIVMLGEGRVGKTSLLHRFVHDRFDEDCTSTQRASMYANLRIPIDRGAASASAGSGANPSRRGGAGEDVADMSIWDTAGQERYHALGPIYYRDAHGAVLVYDITDIESFEKVKVWLKELHEVVGDNIVVTIVGNKSDLERERKVPKKAAEDWAAQQGAHHFIVSAKLGLRVSEPFQDVATRVFEAEMVAASSSSFGAGLGTSSSSGGGGGSGLGVRASSNSKSPSPNRGTSYRGNGGGSNNAAAAAAQVSAFPQRSRGVKVSLAGDDGGHNNGRGYDDEKKRCSC